MTHGKKRAGVARVVGDICSDEDLDQATRELCALMSGAVLSGEDEERFRRLVDSIEAYEDTHYPIPEPSHAALLGHLLGAKGSTPTQAATATGISRRDITAILKGSRDISETEATAFARYFHVEKSVFEETSPVVRMDVVVRSAGKAELQLFGIFFVRGTSVAQVAEYAKNIVNLATALQSPSGALVPFESKFQLAYG